MSMLLMVQAMKTKVGSSSTKLVLLKLADNANDDGLCWPSYQNIADHCEMDRRTAMRHIKKLEDMGFIRVEWRKDNDGQNRTNVYHLTLESGNVSKTKPECKGSDKMTLGGSDKMTPPGDPVTLGGGGNLSPRTSHSFEPVNIPSRGTPRTSFPKLEDIQRDRKNQINESKRMSGGCTFSDLNPDEIPHWAERVAFSGLKTNHLLVWSKFIYHNRAKCEEQVFSINQLDNLWNKWIAKEKIYESEKPNKGHFNRPNGYKEQAPIETILQNFRDEGFDV